ncbi:MAG: acetyl-CoA acetyltransferase [Ilumatobacteraceae bacterium]|nr:acetyl-CoA acetyltransferase [Ilumatobacteraceae bacterium]
MTFDLRGATAIVGVADDADPSGQLPDHGLALEMRIAAEAIADAGLTPDQVDGLAIAGGAMSPLLTAQRLGLRPRWVDSTHVGGSSFELHVEHAAAAIAAGLCDTVLIVYANTPKGDRKRTGALRGDPAPWGTDFAEFEAPYGIMMPLGPYALAAQRHMAVHGTTPEQLARFAVASRSWAADNPRARNREPLTVDDVMAQSAICGPLRPADCCLITDGAGAVVMTRADRARELRPDAAFVLGAASAQSHLTIPAMEDLTVTPGAVSGPNAFAMAGITPADVDVLQIYDSFTITVLLALEDLGFCAKGDGGAFVEAGHIEPGGSLPTNTSGGGLSYTHPGMFGVFLLVEAARQLRGRSSGQVVDDVDISVAHGCGGVLSSTGTIVLGGEATV